MQSKLTCWPFKKTHQYCSYCFKNSIYCKPGYFLQTAAEKKPKPKRLSLIKIFSIKSAVYGILNQTILLIFATQKELKAMFVSLA